MFCEISDFRCRYGTKGMREISMRIFYSLQSLDGYELCHPRRDADFDALVESANGKMHKEWTPLEMRLVASDEGKRLLRSDAPWFASHAPIFRQRAKDALSSIIGKDGEWLPLAAPGEEVWLYNARLVDALDIERSQVRRFQSGRVLAIENYVFLPERLVGVSAFKIPELRASPTFVDETFVEAWRRAGLKGLDFKEAWSN